MPKAITKHNITIKDGEHGIFQTVDYMWNYALRDANTSEAKALVKKLKGASKLATIRNIYDWVVDTVSYEYDPPEYEMVTAPIHYLNGNRSTGDCDCMTTLLVCLLEVAGFESAITIIKWRSDDFTHVFAEVFYDGGWFILDATLGSSGFGKQDKKISEFKRFTKKDMAKLVVLADSPSGDDDGNKDNETVETEPVQTGRIPSRKNRCCPSRANSNKNNININFGNMDSFGKGNVGSNENNNSGLPNNNNSDANSGNSGDNTDDLDTTILDNIRNNTNAGGNISNAENRLIVAEGNKPRNYVAPNKNRTGYVEFP